LVQVFYFRQVPLISEGKVVEIVEVYNAESCLVNNRELMALTVAGCVSMLG